MGRLVKFVFARMIRVTLPAATVCGSSRGALSEMAKWAARKNPIQMGRILTRTHSVMLVEGTEVEVLDVGLGDTKVRVTGIASKTQDPRIGRECWVLSRLLRQ
jgi:hypothetical protein